jgi:hypothetical protein
VAVVPEEVTKNAISGLPPLVPVLPNLFGKLEIGF